MNIRKMQAEDKSAVLEMMRAFYATDAVRTDGSEEIFERDIRACIGDCPFLEGYIFEEQGMRAGYAMVAKSFSTEAGGECLWIEDVYIISEHRKKGFGSEFFEFLDKEYPQTVKKLEVEPENKGALRVYNKCGYEPLPYTVMLKAGM